LKAVRVEGLSKSFSYYTKEVGVLHSLKNLFRRNRLVKEAVKGVSFAIEAGEMVAFLGPNGAGKTTTLKMLSGILHPTSGDVSVLGYKPYERKKEFKRQFAIVMGQKSQLWTDLPASESIVLNRYIYQVEERQYRETLDELVELLDVGSILNVQVRRLSLGERMKMELIAALIHRPRLLFLDEPTIGLDIETQQKLRRFLKLYNEQHRTTILLTSHYLKDIEDLCKRAIIISDGSLVFDGELNRIDDWTDRKKIVKLKFASSVAAELLEPLGTVIQSNGQVVTMEIGSARIQEVSRHLLGRFPVDDFTIEDVPIEDVVLSLYRRGALHDPGR
jgi:ABC-2 type transport system ATP-binding protein